MTDPVKGSDDPALARPDGTVAVSGAAAGTPPAAAAAPLPEGSALSGGRFVALAFLAPAAVLMLLLVVYPIGYTVVRSFFDADGEFNGVDNYQEMFTSSDTLRAIRNNIIWVLVAPTVVTVVGLIFAVLTERVRWSTAFKAVVFMPMAISFLAAGVTFTLIYQQDPKLGLANAAAVGIHDTFKPPAPYTGARPRDNDPTLTKNGKYGYQTTSPVRPGELAKLPLVSVTDEQLGTDPQDAATSVSGPGLTGVVWFDFVRGRPASAGRNGEIEPGEKGLPNVTVEAVRDGKVVASATTDREGRFVFRDLTDGEYLVRLPDSNFAPPYRGEAWLGSKWITPSIILAYIWIWAGFAMVLIAAGLAAIPRDALEAARVDGATEWQVFRRVTIPLVRPVLVVVAVTLVINVLKIFDLVYVLAGERTGASAADVVAVQMWRVSFGGGRDEGMGSALAVLLFLLVLPAMLFNIRRLKREQG